ncbi:hypothetical protein CBM2633_P320002 [Cupriavidus taiwanensis]|uniref:Uncharacterized protein n=3 Tax=Cupriavidus TaxID=106589 RepID=A0A375DS73_9BURK|nr:hypothetical protein pRALTA_0424 [Cupriavidus taiwanensis LMG 19424]SOY75884.1 hypothetical protein CBM2585_P320002 [Cupriavidus taiwanensis]SOZ40627.1 hypothetical protein CBM2605_P320002 [Cupriavidus neocaledonicus]CAP64157.1 hypothetical protein pRALTA_0516 [Cupriavidus taiwanensis LMG 19424]SOZ16375.1 hypothetical protein CBM2597_P190003 [Cupriavidus taiwanensis]
MKLCTRRSGGDPSCIGSFPDSLRPIRALHTLLQVGLKLSISFGEDPFGSAQGNQFGYSVVLLSSFAKRWHVGSVSVYAVSVTASASLWLWDCGRRWPCSQ